MPRFVVRYRAKGPYPAGSLERLRAAGATVVEDSGRMLLVDAPEQALKDALGSDAAWLIAPEVSYSPPNPNPKRSLK